MTEQTFQRGMALLAATWPDRAPSADTLAAYWLVLAELHDSVFEAAIAACLRDCTFYPRPAEIIAKSRQLLTDFGVFPKTPEMAWEEVIAAVSGPRLYGTQFDDGWIYEHGFSSAAVERAAEVVGGLKRIGQTELRDLPFVRQRFLESYEQHRRRAVEYDDAHLLAAPLPSREPQLVEAPRG